MMANSGNRATLTKQLKRFILHYPSSFQKFGKTHEEINISIMKNHLPVEQFKKQYL